MNNNVSLIAGCVILVAMIVFPLHLLRTRVYLFRQVCFVANSIDRGHGKLYSLRIVLQRYEHLAEVAVPPGNSIAPVHPDDATLVIDTAPKILDRDYEFSDGSTGRVALATQNLGSRHFRRLGIDEYTVHAGGADVRNYRIPNDL